MQQEGIRAKPMRWSRSIALSGLEGGIAWDCVRGRKYEAGCTKPPWLGMVLMVPQRPVVAHKGRWPVLN